MQISRHGSTSLLSQSSVGLKDIEHPSSLLPIRVQARCISSERHVKEYIAYYNWTFGGQCGLGAYGNGSPPPFMADQYGYPVVDIYVDSRPPYAPQPRVADISTSSVSFIWDPVADQGDGAGKDFFAAGMGQYSSWLTLGSSTKRLQAASARTPRTLMQSDMKAGER